MKKINCLMALALVASVSVVQAQKGTLVFPKSTETKHLLPPLPTVWVDTNYEPPAWSASRVKPATNGEVVVFEPKPNGEKAALITSAQAQGIIARFKVAYPKLDSPRCLIYVNRELVTAPSGTNASEIERLFALPFRQGGAKLVDQTIAAELIAGKPLAGFIGASAAAPVSKEREAMSKIADVVIEILISPKTAKVASTAENQTKVVPDIQATAIRLSDAKILGQAASNEVTNHFRSASLAGVGMADVIEATALALMDDLSAAQ